MHLDLKLICYDFCCCCCYFCWIECSMAWESNIIRNLLYDLYLPSVFSCHSNRVGMNASGRAMVSDTIDVLSVSNSSFYIVALFSETFHIWKLQQKKEKTKTQKQTVRIQNMDNLWIGFAQNNQIDSLCNQMRIKCKIIYLDKSTNKSRRYCDVKMAYKYGSAQEFNG